MHSTIHLLFFIKHFVCIPFGNFTVYRHVACVCTFSPHIQAYYSKTFYRFMNMLSNVHLVAAAFSPPFPLLSSFLSLSLAGSCSRAFSFVTMPLLLGSLFCVHPCCLAEMTLVIFPIHCVFFCSPCTALRCTVVVDMVCSSVRMQK